MIMTPASPNELRRDANSPEIFAFFIVCDAIVHILCPASLRPSKNFLETVKTVKCTVKCFYFLGSAVEIHKR